MPKQRRGGRGRDVGLGGGGHHVGRKGGGCGRGRSLYRSPGGEMNDGGIMMVSAVRMSQRGFINMNLSSSEEDSTICNSVAESSGGRGEVEQKSWAGKGWTLHTCRVRVEKLKFSSITNPSSRVGTISHASNMDVSMINTLSRDLSILSSSPTVDPILNVKIGSISTSMLPMTPMSPPKMHSTPHPSPSLSSTPHPSPSLSSTLHPSPSLSSTSHPSPNLSNISMVPPLGGGGVSPCVSPVSLVQQQPEPAMRAEWVKQGEVKEEMLVVDVVEKTEQVEDDKEDQGVRSEECSNCMELNVKLEKAERLKRKYEKMLDWEKEQVGLLNKKIKLLEDEQLQQQNSE